MKKVLLTILLLFPFLVNASSMYQEIDILENGDIKVKESITIDGSYNGFKFTLGYKYFDEYKNIYDSLVERIDEEWSLHLADKYATEKVKRDFEQGWQGIEYKLNTVGSSRGDYPFVTMTIGLASDKFGKMASITLLKVHSEGQGKKGFKRPVLFPKIVFLYDKELHGDGSEQYPNADVFNAGIDCSSKTMYPDWLSLTGNGYVPEMYKKYGRVVSPMGCRAFLSPWYEKGGIHPLDENDKPVFEGRCNLSCKIRCHLLL